MVDPGPGVVIGCLGTTLGSKDGPKPVCKDRKSISIEIFGCSVVSILFAAMMWAWFRLRERDQKFRARDYY